MHFIGDSFTVLKRKCFNKNNISIDKTNSVAVLIEILNVAL